MAHETFERCLQVGTSSSERQVLEAFLDDYRDALISKVEGLTEEEARARLVPSLTTPIGLLKHAAAAERGWFQSCLAQRDDSRIDGHARGDAESWHVRADETTVDVITQFRAACSESRRVAARFQLEDTATHRVRGRVSLRWIYVHMIEELARHAGHADILREQLEARRTDPLPSS